MGAHITLFHRLPGEERHRVDADLGEVASAQPTFSVAVTGVRSLGGGVALDLRAPELDALRATLADRWRAWLVPQDRQPFRPHVTVQNKVPAARAKATYDQLAAGFEPEEVGAVGLDLWRYLGGPWEHVGHRAFREAGGAERPR